VPGACEQIVGHLVLTTLNAPVTSQVNAITAILPGGSK